MWTRLYFLLQFVENRSTTEFQLKFDIFHRSKSWSYHRNIQNDYRIPENVKFLLEFGMIVIFYRLK